MEKVLEIVENMVVMEICADPEAGTENFWKFVITLSSAMAVFSFLYMIQIHEEY